jgi:flagellin
MRIQHNISALNASNRLKSNDSAVSKNIAKLSSGYRINSAADDAAGLAVSEKMRSQINGLTQAEDNAQNGESLVQTAEGGLNETSSILQRMNTLAVEASNGTYQNDTDRANLQKEVSALTTEIDRISTSTNFNQINLLDGTLGGFTVATTGFATTGISAATVSGGNGVASVDLTATYVSASSMTLAWSGTAVTGVTFTTDSTSFTSGGTYTFKAHVDAAQATEADAQKYEGMEVTVTLGTGTIAANATNEISATSSGNPLTLQVGADNTNNERATLSIGDMSSKGLGLSGISVATQDSAKAAIDTIKKAINTVDGTRADLGALQNELEHTSNNISTMNENLTSAESNIRDVDMSDEYVQYSKNQILSQAANSMLAQANSQPQSVLTLLKG